MKTCIHTVILNELDEYLKVWLDHHTKMVDHIFIFEDLGSHSHKHVTDNYPNVTLMQVADLYSESGKERLIKNRERGGINQMFYVTDGVMYIQALKQYDWCFTIDIDEFITLEEPYEAIPDVLSEFQDNDAILIHWLNFGANGRIYKPNYDGRDYREFYTERAEQTNNDKSKLITTKICWNLNKITRWNLCGLHACAGHWVNTDHQRDRKSVCYKKMYLKHYITKSWEEYLWKLYKRGMHCPNHRKIQDFFEINPSLKERYDELISIKNNILNV